MKIPILILSSLLLIVLNTKGQTSSNLLGLSLPGLQKILYTETPLPSLLKSGKPIFRPLTMQEKLKVKNVSLQQMPLVYAYKDLGLFCKLEVKMEKSIKMPVKVRLGSADYVDWLEGKRSNY